jgi:phage-related minor tail protein
MRRALTDNRATLQERLDNYQRAHSNYEFVSLELERVENKIKSLAELTVNRQDPEYISGQIDAVADSMMETERTMNDLLFVTGLGEVDEEAPELISEPEAFVID